MEGDRIFRSYQREYAKKSERLSGSVETAIDELQKMAPGKEYDELLEAIVAAEQPFVQRVAEKYKTFFAKRMDCIQEGNDGLLEAIQRFDPSKNPHFEKYADFWVRGRIIKFIIDSSRQIKLGGSKDAKKMQFNLIKELEALEASGAEVSSSALAERLGIEDENKVAEARAFLTQPGISYGNVSKLSLRDEMKEGIEVSVEESVAEAELAVFVRKNLRQFIPRLSGRDRFILENYVLREDPMTLEEVGKAIGLSRERVRNLKNDLLRRLGKYFLSQQGRRDIPLDKPEGF